MDAAPLNDPDQIRRMAEATRDAEPGKYGFAPDPEPEAGGGNGHDHQEGTATGTDPDQLNFPTWIITGLAGSFAGLYASVLETPVHFLFIAFLTCLGSVLADRLTLASELQTQPRLYVLLLGESADDRKSTAINKAVGFFMDALTDFRVCWGVGSAEGLQKRMEDGGRLLLCLDEFKSFVSKCKIESSVLLPCVTTLFESNRYESHTKTTAVKLENAFLSLLAASTVQTYERTWDSNFSDIGMTNRLLIVPGSGQRKFAFPPRVPVQEKIILKSRLGDLLQFVGPRLEMGITPEAHALYEGWYLTLERSVHSKRLDGYALRFMGLLAVNEFEREITPAIVRKATALMNWQLEVRKQFDPIDADSTTAKLEERIRRVLAEGPRTDRELKQNTNARRAGLWIYEAAKRNLERGREIQFDRKGKVWKKV
jgi:hypothetical protein